MMGQSNVAFSCPLKNSSINNRPPRRAYRITTNIKTTLLIQI